MIQPPPRTSRVAAACDEIEELLADGRWGHDVEREIRTKMQALREMVQSLPRDMPGAEVQPREIFGRVWRIGEMFWAWRKENGPKREEAARQRPPTT